MDDQRDAHHAKADIEQDEQLPGECIRIVEVEFHFVGDYQYRADSDEYHADRDDCQQREGEEITGMSQEKPHATAVGVVQSSQG